jgi:hypothetical protein
MVDRIRRIMMNLAGLVQGADIWLNTDKALSFRCKR